MDTSIVRCCVFAVLIYIVKGFKYEDEELCYPTPNFLPVKKCGPHMKKLKLINSNDLSNILLKKLQNDTCIIIHGHQILNETIHLFNVHNLTITTSEDYSASPFKISCKQNVGMSFENSSNILFSNLRFDECGGKFKSTSTPPNGSEITPNISTALYFNQTVNIGLYSVKIVSSNGYGIVMYDCGGSLNFEKLCVRHGKCIPYTTGIGDTEKIWKGYSSGGGVYLEYTKFGQPIYLQGNQISFSDCSLRYNIGEYNISIPENSTHHVPFGHGGGMALFFLGSAIKNNVSITGIKARYNKAAWGGSVFIELSSHAKRNNITFSNGQIHGSTANFSGGGVRIVTYPNINTEERNNLTFKTMFFFGNRAKIGGSFIHYGNSKHQASGEAKIIFQTCSFTESIAKLGAAVYLDTVSAHFKDVTLKNNSATDPYTDCGDDIYQSLGFGAIYAYRSDIYITGTKNVFRLNSNTAFLLDYSKLFVNGYLLFSYNRGGNGGALALYEHSEIILSNKTVLKFQNNTGSIGGAMYVKVPGPPVTLGKSPKLSVYKCFFQVKEGFSGKVEFSGNTATTENGNAIYATSLLNCVGENGNNPADVITNWRNFNFSQNPQPINTDVVCINITNDEWKNHYAGQIFNPTIKLYDERDELISSSVDIDIKSNRGVTQINDNRRRFVVIDKTVELSLVTKDQEDIFDLTISSSQGKARSKTILVQFGICKFGYSFHKHIKKCICDAHVNQALGIAYCLKDETYLFENMWSKPNSINTKFNNIGRVVTCPDNYCALCMKNPLHTKNPFFEHGCLYQPRNQCAIDRDQSSLLCSRCKNGTSVKFGSEKCETCKKNWSFMFLVLLFGTLITVLIIMVLNIDFYGSYLNSVVFFYQVVHLLYIQSSCPAMKFIVGAINLNGLNGYIAFCIVDGLNDMSKMALNSSIPLLMILWLVVINGFSNMKVRCCRNLYFSKNKCFNAIVFIMMFAFGNITRVIFNLMRTVKLDDKDAERLYIYADVKTYHQRESILLYAYACALLIFIISFLIALFSSDSSWIRHCCGVKCKSLFDNFNKPYKQNSWIEKFSGAGYYYFCRFLIMFIGYIIPHHQGSMQLMLLTSVCVIILLVFSIAKPYKSNVGKIKKISLNLFDVAVLANLTAIAVLSNGKRKLFNFDAMTDVLGYCINVLMWPPLIAPVFCCLRRMVQFAKDLYSRYRDFVEQKKKKREEAAALIQNDPDQGREESE